MDEHLLVGWLKVFKVDMQAVIKVHNNFIGGVVGDDWLLSQFRPKVKTMSWVPNFEVFPQVFNCAVGN
jgi:hypothetical protein